MGADPVRNPIVVESASRLEVTLPPPPPPPTAPVAERSLTRSAVLTAIASLVDYGAQLVTTLVVTPIVVNGLGGPLFGVWEMLKQSVGYMTATDGRPMDALRLVTANQQANPDAGLKRRYVGAALIVWLLFLPVVTLAGAILVGLTPTITKVAPELRGTIQIACALLVLGFLTGTLAAIPEAVLRGMNLGYKRMGWQAGLSVVGGVLAAGAVSAGWGLEGLGAAQLALAGLTGMCFWVLVRRYVPAFGVARPSKPEVTSLLRMSAWLTGGQVLSQVLLASDVLILGVMVSPALVATYVLTGAAARMAVTLFNFTVGATIPGLGGLLGQQEYDRAAQIRGDLVTLTWLFVTVGGAAILLWNRSFVSLWVGGQHYAGVWANLLIVGVMTQTAFIRGDAFVIDAALRPRSRVIVTAVAGALTVAAALALTPALGIVGLCLGLLAGRLPQTLIYPQLVASCLGRSRTVSLAPIARRLAVMAVAFAGAAWLGQRVLVHDWLTWLGGVALTGVVLLGVVLVAGLSPDARRAVLARCRAMGRTVRG
ncbi:MAG: lipopolysaccharide biosynthesis protein [Gemmatimonadales bacterium]